MPVPCAAHVERTHDFHCAADGKKRAVGRFDAGVFPARVGDARPEPAIVALAADRVGAAPSELLFIDDHAPNVAAARAAGWQAHHHTDEAAPEAALVTHGLRS